nr:LacI family DNA-binding transcriptional regulator [Sinorhizobium sp. Sb3]
MKRPTIRQIAATAGVSVATVNRYLAGSPSLRPATRTTIETAIKTLDPHYGQPSPSILSRSCRIGFVLPCAENLYGRTFGAAIKLAAASRRNRNLHLRVEYVENSPSGVGKRWG